MFRKPLTVQARSVCARKIETRSIGVRGRGEKREPSPYIELPYIVSKGNSWADTGLYLDPTIHRVQGSFIVDSLDMVSVNNFYRLEGARDDGGGSAATKVGMFLRKLSPTTFEIRRDWGALGSAGAYDPVIYEVGKEYSFDFTPEYTQVGELKIEKTAYSRGACTNTYYIGSFNDSILSATYVSPAVRGTKRIFSVYSTGEVIGLSTPTFAKETNIFDYFDKVSGKYLENKGTEPWTAAYETWVYQMGRPLSYLKSDGNQWIDTKFIISEGLNYQIETNLRKSPNTGTQFLYGAGASSSSIDNVGAYVSSNNATLLVIKRKDSASDTDIEGDQLNNYALLTQNKNGGVFGEIPYTLQELRDVYPPYSFYLFAMNRGDVVTLPSDGLEANFWRVRDLDNDTYAINLIPFITWEGVKGYLNLVNRELLLNQGTGEFEVPLVPVYALNWQDENFDPIVGKVAEIGSGISYEFFNDWTEAQKLTFRGKKMKVSWKLSVKNITYTPLEGDWYGFSTFIYYKDGTSTRVGLYQLASTLFNGMESPYNFDEDSSFATTIDIEDKEIDNIIYKQNYFRLQKVQSGELKAYDIKWEVDVPEYEIEAIETLNASGIQAYANHEDNINALNRIGIKI